MNYRQRKLPTKKAHRIIAVQRLYELYETNVNGEQKRMLKRKGTDLLYVYNVSKNKLKVRYANVTKEAIQLYVDMCESPKVIGGETDRFQHHERMNSRCQVDLKVPFFLKIVALMDILQNF